ncbi:hypothetical protein EIP91_004387 [Steccherinum ochraceum]|uniref:UDENN domain-containing protein n=1 Tax=Steccherinum ochraceum TaxID=92696 RepID=A0A4V2MXI0_9APHY|nr:hypothetical protein EIP91_004387 [Steccherinum ochraceum]
MSRNIMDEETDIGLSSLSRRSGSSTSSPPQVKRHVRRPSGITIVEEKFVIGNMLTPLRSPSSPNLLLKDLPPSSPRATRKLSRSNTLPRVQPNNPEELDSLSMEHSRVLKLRRWIHALVIVNFDLEYGPKITKTFPPLSLSPAEAENIAFSSFPDAPQVELGSQMHSFRIRPHDPQEDKLVRSDEDRPKTADGFMYGYSHFTQRRDTTSKRGYQQTSLVILSPHPFPALFHTLLSYLGQSFLMHGAPILEVACHNIANWLDPAPGASLELGFLGFVFTAELPSGVDTPQSAMRVSVREYDQDVKILASLPPPHPALISAFEACLQHMWSIWECLVLCEPILVFGASASATSQAVWWLRDVLRPIPLTGDFRPFFTIHDADYSVFVNPRPPQPGTIIGVTNPIIERTCKHWPHLISLGALVRKEKHIPLTPKTPHTPWTPADSPMTAGPPPGWRSKSHKRYISRDRTVLKKIESACRGDERAQLEASHALRQHFSARTTALLAPLQRYLNTLIPSPAEAALSTPTPSTRNFHNLPSSRFSSSANSSPITPHARPAFLGAHTKSTSSTPNTSNAPSPVYSNPPTPLPPGSPMPPTATRLKPFNTSAFLASLSSPNAVTTLPFKSSAKQKEFYERWLRSRAFGVWLGQQEEVVKRVLEERVATATAATFGSGVHGSSAEHLSSATGKSGIAKTAS